MACAEDNNTMARLVNMRDMLVCYICGTETQKLSAIQYIQLAES